MGSWQLVQIVDVDELPLTPVRIGQLTATRRSVPRRPPRRDGSGRARGDTGRGRRRSSPARRVRRRGDRPGTRCVATLAVHHRPPHTPPRPHAAAGQDPGGPAPVRPVATRGPERHTPAGSRTARAEWAPGRRRLNCAAGTVSCRDPMADPWVTGRRRWRLPAPRAQAADAGTRATSPCRDPPRWRS